MSDEIEDEIRSREEQADKLSDFQIWYSVICKFVNMPMPKEAKAGMILQTIGDEPLMIKDVLEAALKDDKMDSELVTEVMEVLKLEHY